MKEEDGGVDKGFLSIAAFASFNVFKNVLTFNRKDGAGFWKMEMVLWEIILIIPWSKGGGDEIIFIFFFLRIHKSKVKIISLLHLYNVGDEFNITILVKEKKKKLKNS